MCVCVCVCVRVTGGGSRSPSHHTKHTGRVRSAWVSPPADPQTKVSVLSVLSVCGDGSCAHSLIGLTGEW